MIKNMTKKTFDIPLAPLATLVKPSNPATTDMTKNIMAHLSMIFVYFSLIDNDNKFGNHSLFD